MTSQPGWKVTYDGFCSVCETPLPAGTKAVYDWARKKLYCLTCAGEARPTKSSAIDTGVAGGSARRRYERSLSQLEAERKARFGDRLGGFIHRFKDEPQSIRAWGLGARGEELLGAALEDVPDLVTLNDRRVPGTRGNIDHIAIGPAGVFVIDAKFYEGRMVRVVDRGSFFRSDLRLTVGGRDKSDLADNMDWQVEALTDALVDAGVDRLPPISPVLCFVAASWPILTRPKIFSGVRLESERSIVKLLAEPRVLRPGYIDHLAAILAEALPGK